MEPPMNEDQLLQVAQRLVADGLLPASSDGVHSFGGRSRGALCGLCSVQMSCEDAEIELAWEHAGLLRVAVLHPWCHVIWTAATRA